MATKTATKSSGTIFSQAKATAQPKEKKDDKHLEVIVPEKEFAGFNAKIRRNSELEKIIEDASGELETNKGEIREFGKKKFVQLVNEKKCNPNTFKLRGEGKDSAAIMIVPTDRYIKIDQERAEQLTETYGEEIVESETTFSFNTEVLMKYEKEISDMIKNNAKISAEDKAKLIVADTKYTVKKGTIDRLYDYFGETKKVEEVFTQIQPVFQVKGCKS